ncbi:LysR family transcriptional regulator [Niallia sp. Man26]|uniref:LysR family transcriptional regulator n=1 Tax=Niallia sp. Man26 TaxID=2912824 RepID=UPI001EDB2232|nr:LysR family transcriptional regulator [Niallia sp. Man26]UPO89974.1 LysR family transcriptional regulator [Niallia sp. Man26]
MNIEQLMYIVEVAKVRSLGEAAKTLNISQSALSQAITKFENELNIKIFNRTRAGTIPTKEGDLLIAKSQNALKAIYQIEDEAKQINHLNDLLRITVIPGLIGPIVDTYLDYKKKDSKLKIEINEKSSMDIIVDLKNDKIDIGFIAINRKNMDAVTGFQFTPVRKGKLLVFASKDSVIAKTKDVIKPNVLKEQLFVLYKDEYVQSFISNFNRLYGPIDIFLKTTDTQIITNTILKLEAITIGHDISAEFNQNFPYKENIVALEIENFSDTSFTFGWIKKHDNKLARETNLFIEKVSNILIK